MLSSILGAGALRVDKEPRFKLTRSLGSEWTRSLGSESTGTRARRCGSQVGWAGGSSRRRTPSQGRRREPAGDSESARRRFKFKFKLRPGLGGSRGLGADSASHLLIQMLAPAYQVSARDQIIRVAPAYQIARVEPVLDWDRVGTEGRAQFAVVAPVVAQAVSGSIHCRGGGRGCGSRGERGRA